MHINKQVLVLIALFCSGESFGQAAKERVDLEEHKYYVGNSEDDAEEGTSGEVDLTNEDLDLGQLSGFESAAKIGIRFEKIDIPCGCKIKRAFLRFTMEGNRAKSKPTQLTIRAELVPNAAVFKSTEKNISARKLSKASVTWSPEPWDPKLALDKKPQTPDLSALIQEIIDQQDWVEGNAIALIISGKGERDAVSFDGGGKQQAPQLHVETD